MNRLEDQYKSTIHQLVQRVMKLEKWKRDVTGDSPLFDIANEHSPATLTTNQNDYDPGYYDVLRVNASADVSITGISKGKKGRFLEFFNVSGQRITFPYESAASLPANRIINSSGEDVILFPTGRLRLYYDSTTARWFIPDMPSYRGMWGMSTIVTLAALTQSIASGVYYEKVLLDTLNPYVGDEYGFFDSANNQFEIPVGKSGFYIVTFSAVWDSAVDWLIRGIRIKHDSIVGIGDTGEYFAETDIPLDTPGLTVCVGIPCLEGDTISFWAYQETGAPLDLQVPQASIVRVL